MALVTKMLTRTRTRILVLLYCATYVFFLSTLADAVPLAHDAQVANFDTLIGAFGKIHTDEHTTTTNAGPPPTPHRTNTQTTLGCSRAALVQVQGHGSHRFIHVKIRRHLGEQTRGEHCHTDCPHAALTIGLPSGVFVDADELKRLRLPNSVNTTYVTHKRDECVLSESPAQLCHPSLLVVSWDAIHVSPQATFAIHVHARYPPPDVAEVAMYTIDLPKTLARCKDADDWSVSGSPLVRASLIGGDKSSSDDEKKNTVTWLVHAIDPSYHDAANNATATAILVGASAIIITAVCSREHERTKKRAPKKAKAS